ncbi:hypothetical protein C4D60_Mb06t26700 [Musa balbisiana]|uniref:Uncharacterized protein n=1 Tax=Musa balbisiana TaxID=52838 RepID=A0A4S8IRL0_MUSBA|nr:hypothetical protein C4D60_Mb06t26700 [Musa balbisiana]
MGDVSRNARAEKPCACERGSHRIMGPGRVPRQPGRIASGTGFEPSSTRAGTWPHVLTAVALRPILTVNDFGAPVPAKSSLWVSKGFSPSDETSVDLTAWICCFRSSFLFLLNFALFLHAVDDTIRLIV